jgi:hypothetical protein
MKNVRMFLKAFFIAVTSGVIFIAASYSFIIDVNYFFTKKETFGTIIKLTRGDVGKDLSVQIRYFNSYLNQKDTCYIHLSNSYWQTLNNSDLGHVRIDYSKGRVPIVYLADIKSPYFAIIFFDLLLMILAGIAYSSVFRHKAQSSGYKND